MSITDKYYVSVFHWFELFEKTNEYRETMPDAYSFEQIGEHLRKYVNEPMGFTFGLDIAKGYEKESYGFEVYEIKPNATVFKYLGVWQR